VTEALESHIDATVTDLVVTTTHGRGHLARFWLGSVADHLMRHVAVPVILVRPSEKVPAPEKIEKILVALDGSAFAEQALRQAAELAKSFEVPVELLCVVEPSMPIADPVGMVLLPPTPEAERTLLARSAAYLESIAKGLRSEGVQVVCTSVLGAPVAAAILEQGQKSRASLIALATHGLGGLRRILLGSVADRLVRDATAPVMVIRPVPGNN
jgi:nucleotide-binding universal stress UspA family protein